MKKKNINHYSLEIDFVPHQSWEGILLPVERELSHFPVTFKYKCYINFWI